MSLYKSRYVTVRPASLFASSGILLARAQFLGSQLLLEALQREEQCCLHKILEGKMPAISFAYSVHSFMYLFWGGQ